MTNVVQLFPTADAPTILRSIASAIESGEYPKTDCTVILGSRIFHAGTVDDAEAAQEAVWNMTYGIHKLMFTALSAEVG